MKLLSKKNAMNEVIGVFILVLVISILAGMTFLFVAGLKTQMQTTAQTSETFTVTAESVTPTVGGTGLAYASLRNAACTITDVHNSSITGIQIRSANYT
jgi:FlaG/FlaF family flagellin (archaellin)